METKNEQMSVSEKNKKFVQHVYEEISKGNLQAFIDAVTDDFIFKIIGKTPFSVTYKGIQEVVEKALVPIGAALKNQPRLVVDKIIADGDYVVVIDHGEGGISQKGKEYNNTYCNVIRMSDGKIAEITEYCDTALVNTVLCE